MKTINPLLVIIMTILLIPAVFSLGVRTIPGSFQPSLVNTYKIYKDIIAEQVLTSSFDRFSGVGVSIKNPNLANKKNITMFVYQDSTLLRKVVLNGRSIADGNFVKFIFDPIQDSKNNNYRIIFTAETADASDALEIFLTDQDKDLSYVSFYSPQNTLMLVFTIYQNWFNKLSQDKLFFAAYTLLMLSTLSYLILKKNVVNKAVN